MGEIGVVCGRFFLYTNKGGLYMEKESTVKKLTQKDYQKKYDKKTQSVTIKYTPADMSDYDRMMKYLESNGKSRSSFIKELINDFFEKKRRKYYCEILSRVLCE